MSEKDNKFILGDNSDGYRRSAESEKTQPVYLPPKRPAQRRSAPPSRPSQRPTVNGRASAGSPSGQRRRPASPQGQRPTAKRPASNAAQRVRRSPQQPQNMSELSPNERRKLHNELRRKQRRRKQIMTYVAVSFVVLAMAVILSLTVFFQISEITISGSSPYTDEQIIDASGISIGENVIRCKADAVSENLAKNLPYIDSASVERSLSGKVKITVKTTAPVWSVINGEQSILINAKGKVLELGAPEKALEATIIQGVSVTHAVPGETVAFSEEVSFDFVKEIGDAVASAGLDKLTTLNLVDTDYIQALYDGRLTIIIGSTDNLAKKLALTAKVIERENEIDPDQYGTIDLTIEDKLYFRPAENDELADDEPQENVTEMTSDAA